MLIKGIRKRKSSLKRYHEFSIANLCRSYLAAKGGLRSSLLDWLWIPCFFLLLINC